MRDGFRRIDRKSAVIGLIAVNHRESAPSAPARRSGLTHHAPSQTSQLRVAAPGLTHHRRVERTSAPSAPARRIRPRLRRWHSVDAPSKALPLRVERTSAPRVRPRLRRWHWVAAPSAPARRSGLTLRVDAPAHHPHQRAGYDRAFDAGIRLTHHPHQRTAQARTSA